MQHPRHAERRPLPGQAFQPQLRGWQHDIVYRLEHYIRVVSYALRHVASSSLSTTRLHYHSVKIDPLQAFEVYLGSILPIIDRCIVSSATCRQVKVPRVCCLLPLAHRAGTATWRAAGRGSSGAPSRGQARSEWSTLSGSPRTQHSSPSQAGVTSARIKAAGTSPLKPTPAPCLAR